jgi:hypothetical protein
VKKLVRLVFPAADPRAFLAWFEWSDRIQAEHNLPPSLNADYEDVVPLRAQLLAAVTVAIEDDVGVVAPEVEFDDEILSAQASLLEHLDRWCQGMIARGTPIEPRSSKR